MMSRVKVRFTGHSGFLLEMESRFLLFDHVSDEAGVLADGLPFLGNGVVFVSHRHADHFDPDVLKLGKNGITRFVIDSGVTISQDNRPAGIHMITPGAFLDLGWATVRTFGSTDEGCSFLVNAAGLGIFHAGDLNDWYWEDESTPEELADDENRYLGELAKIFGSRVDIAFFPVDLRLGKNAARGAMHFARVIKPRFLFPMHTNGRLDLGMLPGLLRTEGINTTIVHMSDPGDEALIEP
jgi:L-ascorbate metabolism protein UlaG (beta-lactamase superfamily)